jgi:hypothetical protein
MLHGVSAGRHRQVAKVQGRSSHPDQDLASDRLLARIIAELQVVEACEAAEPKRFHIGNLRGRQTAASAVDRFNIRPARRASHTTSSR